MASGPSLETDYSGLLKATITYDYLHTNSTTHEFVFGAIAELVDNSRDAGAKNLKIDYVEEIKGLTFLDDGVGMVPEEAQKIVAFGHSLKRCETGKVGRYGNGLKSGALRLGTDFMVFTKRAGYLTALMLSRTFHMKMGIKDVIVPAPQFTDALKPITDGKKHEMEMKLIYEYSPFKNETEFAKQFNQIEGDSGTLVVLYNLRRIETGEYEMDFITDWSDVGLTDVPPEREPEKNSLRAYLSILYLNPYTKIYLRGKKVKTIRIQSTLGDAYTYTKECSFKGAKEKMLKEVQQEKKLADEEVKRTKSEYGIAINSVKEIQGISSLEITSRTRLHNLAMCSATDRLKKIKERETDLQRNKNKAFPAEFSCGMNIHHRNRYGCMIYNNGRLIDMYVKLPFQKENHDLYLKGLGVVGVVDLPYEVLEPTHNKQSFESKRDYQVVLRAFNDCMEQYWEDKTNMIGHGPQDIKRYWTAFGYHDSSWSSECSQTIESRHKRFQKTNHVAQCDVCLKWRTIEYQQSYVLNGVPDNWRCTDHPDSSKRDCSLPEHFGKLNPAKRKLKPKLKKPAAHAPTSLAGQKPPPNPFPPQAFNPAPQRAVSQTPSSSGRITRPVSYQEHSGEDSSHDDVAPARQRGRPPKSGSSNNSSPAKSNEPLRPTPANRPVREIRKRTLDGSYAVPESEDDDVPAKKPQQPKVSPVRRSLRDSTPSSSDEDEDEVDRVVSSKRPGPARNGPYQTGPVPPRMAEAAERKRREEEEMRRRKAGVVILKSSAAKATKPIVETRPTRQIMPNSDDDDEEPSQASSGRLSTSGAKKTNGAPQKIDKPPSRRVVSDSEEEEKEDEEAPKQPQEPKKARTKADLRKELDKNETLSPPPSLPDHDDHMAPTIMDTTPAREDIRSTPQSLKTNGVGHSDPQKEIELLRKKLAELEIKQKATEKRMTEVENNNVRLTKEKGEIAKERDLLKADAVKDKEKIAQLSAVEKGLKADKKVLFGHLHNLLKQLCNRTNSVEIRELMQACEAERTPGAVNWEDVVKKVVGKIQETCPRPTLRQSVVYPNEAKLINDMQAVLRWVSSAKVMEFSEPLNPNNCFHLFTELGMRLGAAQDAQNS